MTQYEMTERLSEKMNITLEAAKAALEASDWNMLTATHYLEQENFRRMQELNEVATACAVQTAPEETPAEPVEAVAAAAPADDAEEVTPVKVRKRCQGLRHLSDHIRRLVACGNRNRFIVHKNGEQMLEMPVTALVLLLLCSFGTCALLLAVGLFAGCRYSFSKQGVGVKA